MPEKPWHLSKTVWFNVISIVAALLAMPEISSVIPPDWLKFIVAINATINVILRFISTAALTK